MKKLSYLLRLTIYFVIVIVFFVCCFSFKNTGKPNNENNSLIIEVWQLDMVEGGLGSRKTLLEKVAKQFEKNNSGVLVSVVNETVTSAEQKFNNGIFPDIISYSSGLEGFFEKTVAIENNSSLDCGYDKKTFATCWAFGGYCYITSKNSDITKLKKCIVSQNDFSLPLFAYYLSDLRFEQLEVKQPKVAYQEFVNQKDVVLLGTQRDLYRLNSRNFECDFQAIDEFSDITQYISVISDDKIKRNHSQNYVNCLLSDGQALVSDIGLCPIKGETKNDTLIKQMSLSSSFSTTSVFLGKSTIKNAQEYLISSANNEKEKITYIKNLLK